MSALKILFTKQHIDVFGRCAKWLAKQGVRSQQHADGAYGEKSKMLNLFHAGVVLFVEGHMQPKD